MVNHDEKPMRWYFALVICTSAVIFTIALALFGAMLGGAGHGTSLPYEVGLAPHSWGFLLWPLVGNCLAFRRFSFARVAAFLLVALHWYSVYEVLATEQTEHWREYVRIYDVPAGVIASIHAVIYLGGQIMILALIFLPSSSRK